MQDFYSVIYPLSFTSASLKNLIMHVRFSIKHSIEVLLLHVPDKYLSTMTTLYVVRASLRELSHSICFSTFKWEIAGLVVNLVLHLF